ncbi:Predicted oxidoreductase [Pseudorhodobacter antarcticus]|jgi:aryl-alcohol dehydrogenase-like predicted oxidoreductase|uniref:Predicted oxidoreductase n=1 Tax=Pseudorhodobacter antarcticus TaxID=1077947 RepID=A0A1H8KRP3_9RHOB|nr:aldo/keto reductase [Pseudorhodobacter antarcticus]SEN95559.1 Predicted oxidoreductase [Pseudorhodobacter antarcticus]
MVGLTTKSGARVSRLGFGAMQFGRTCDEAAARAMFEACLDAGINHFDTAFSYTGGASERMLGGLVAGLADRMIVASKAANDRPATRANLRDACDQSRARLGLDCIDLYYLHRFDDDTPLEETFGALTQMQAAGIIRYIGVSNFAAWQVMKAQAVCAQFGTKIDAIQPMYNLVKRQVEVEILPACHDQAIAVCPFSPLGGGLLTGKYGDGGRGRLVDDAIYAARYGQPWMHQTARDLCGVAGALGVDPATLAVAWVAHHADITSTLISARSVAQLQPSLLAMGLDLPTDIYAQISALSQTPTPATDRSEAV